MSRIASPIEHLANSPTTSTAAAGHPDAEILSLSAQFEYLANEADRLMAHASYLDQAAARLADHDDIDQATDDANGRHDAANDRAQKLASAILRSNASTVEGLIAKAKVAAWRHGCDPANDTNLHDGTDVAAAFGIVHDLLKLLPEKVDGSSALFDSEMAALKSLFKLNAAFGQSAGRGDSDVPDDQPENWIRHQAEHKNGTPALLRTVGIALDRLAQCKHPAMAADYPIIYLGRRFCPTATAAVRLASAEMHDVDGVADLSTSIGYRTRAAAAVAHAAAEEIAIEIACADTSGFAGILAKTAVAVWRTAGISPTALGIDLTESVDALNKAEKIAALPATTAEKLLDAIVDDEADEILTRSIFADLLAVAEAHAPKKAAAADVAVA